MRPLARSWQRRAVRLLCAACLLGGARAAIAGTPTFADIAPILQARCVVCHAGEAAPRKLRLDSHEAILAGSEQGPVVRSGDPAGSTLIRRVRGQVQPRMPLVGDPLAEREIVLIEKWIAAGLPKGAAPPPPAVARPKPGEPVTYAHVAPLLLQRCAKCHSGRGIMGPPPEGYRLDSYAQTLAPAERVRVIPGNPQASELIRRIRGQSRPRMPFDGPPYLSEDDTRLLETWIAQGARSADGQPSPVPTGARVRLEGTLTGPSKIDDISLRIGSGTRIDKNPRIGDRVRVEAVVESDGGIRATRIRRR